METAWDRAQRMLDSYMPTLRHEALAGCDGSATTGNCLDDTPVMLGCVNCAYDAKGLPAEGTYELRDVCDDMTRRYKLTPHKKLGFSSAKCLKCGLERRWGL